MPHEKAARSLSCFLPSGSISRNRGAKTGYTGKSCACRSAAFRSLALGFDALGNASTNASLSRRVSAKNSLSRTARLAASTALLTTNSVSVVP